jgi:hypothetical protein
MTPVTPKTTCYHGEMSDLSDEEDADKQAVLHKDEPLWKNHRDNVLKANQEDMKRHRLPKGHFSEHEPGTSAVIVNNTYNNCNFGTTNVVNQTVTADNRKRTAETTGWATTPAEREAKSKANWREHIAKFKFPPPPAPEPTPAEKEAQRLADLRAHIAKFKFSPPPAPKPTPAPKEFTFHASPVPNPKPAPAPEESVLHGKGIAEKENEENEIDAELEDDKDIDAPATEESIIHGKDTANEANNDTEAEPEDDEDIDTVPEDTPISAAHHAWQKRRWGKHESFNRLIHRWSDDNMYLAWDGARPKPTVYDDYERHVTRSNGEWPYLHMSPRDLRALLHNDNTSAEVKTLLADVIGTTVVNFTIRNPMERQTYYDYPNWSSSPDESHDIVYE